MTWQERIRTAFERNAKALSLRPSVGQGTAVTKVRMRDGLTCDIEEGAWKLTAGMSEKSGGDNGGPNPGILGRAALGSCLAISYAMWAAKLGVSLSSLEVEVQADYDSRGALGVGSAPAGYRQVRYVVKVESGAPEAEVMRMLDLSDEHCAYLDVFRRGQDVRREVQWKGTGR